MLIQSRNGHSALNHIKEFHTEPNIRGVLNSFLLSIEKALQHWPHMPGHLNSVPGTHIKAGKKDQLYKAVL